MNVHVGRWARPYGAHVEVAGSGYRRDADSLLRRLVVGGAGTVAVPMAFAIHVTFVASVTDPMFFLPTISALLAVGIFAAAVPAFRASRIDPIAALRQE